MTTPPTVVVNPANNAPRPPVLAPAPVVIPARLVVKAPVEVVAFVPAIIVSPIPILSLPKPFTLDPRAFVIPARPFKTGPPIMTNPASLSVASFVESSRFANHLTPSERLSIIGSKLSTILFNEGSSSSPALIATSVSLFFKSSSCDSVVA